MPVKPVQRAEVNSFVSGIITEASPLNFPPNASIDEQNFDMHKDGSRSRRLGMDFEDTARQIAPIGPQGLQNSSISSYIWKGVGGRNNLEILVIQANNTLRFYDALAEGSISERYMGEVVIGEFPTETPYSITSLEGMLVVAAGSDSVAVVEYTNTFVLSYTRIKVRDVWGIEETISNYETDYTYRGPMNNIHSYNLQNQSWGIERNAEIDVPVFGIVRVRNPDYNPPTDNREYLWEQRQTGTRKGAGMADPIKVYFDKYKKAPSNSEQIWPGMQVQPVAREQTPFERMFPHLYEQVLGVATEGAKGYYIIDALRRGQSRAEEVNRNNAKFSRLQKYSTNFPTDFTPGGAKTVAEFAGRVFFSGFQGETTGGDKRSPNLLDHVFFSKLVKSKIDIGKCYQEGDPTSRDTYEIVDTDGGHLRISGALNISSLVQMGSNLFVIAENGVWMISGGSDYGFSATNYKVTKLTTFGSISPYAMVSEGDTAFYWSEEGIQAVAKDQFGDYQVSSLTEATIDTLYKSIPTSSKISARGIYDISGNKVRWLYTLGEHMTPDAVTMELVLDISLGAFTVNRIETPDNSPVSVFTAFQTRPYNIIRTLEGVVVNSNPVVVEGEVIGVVSETLLNNTTSVKYIVFGREGDNIVYGVGSYNNSRFVDWESTGGGVDAKGYLLTGKDTTGDSAINKQIPYLVTHMLQTEKSIGSDFLLNNPSSCFIQGRWGFTTSVESGRWTRPMQAYRIPRGRMRVDGSKLDTGYELVTSKNKLRGKGESYSILFETEPLKDCHIFGWNISLTGNPNT